MKLRSQFSAAALQERFRIFAGRDGRVSFAPGRVNLIGEHTDYTAGFVLPASLALGTWAVAAPRDDRSVRVFSENHNELAVFSLQTDPAQARRHWSDYVAGVAWALQRSGRQLRGVDVLVASDVPIGSGLSSSAALEVSVAYALLAAAGLAMTPLEIAQSCRLAENQFAGARCGIMDQFVATHGQRNRALLLDCDSYEWRTVPLPATHHWIVANTMVRHALAHGEYNVRRAECEEIVALAARRMPYRARLAELDAAEVGELMHELSARLGRRLRHLVAENRRVLDAVGALESGEIVKLGRLLIASHESLRADFEVSCPELNRMVDIAVGLPGVVGARMIGGGFGGCTLTLVEEAHAENVMAQLRAKYVEAGGLEPSIYRCEFGNGAGTLA